MGTDILAVPFQKRAALRFGADAAFAQGRVAQHVPDRHPGRFQAIEKLDPGQDRCVVVPLAGPVPVGAREQADPLVIADRIGRKARTLCQLTNLHGRSFVTTRRRLGL